MKTCLGFLLVVLAMFSNLANAEESFQLNISAGELSAALNELALQAGVALHFDPSAVKGKTTEGLKGSFSLRKGFETLLKSTGLMVSEAGGAYFIEQPLVSASNELMLDSLEVYASDLAHTEIYQSPSSVSKLDLQQLEQATLRDTADVFQSVAGVITAQSRQDPGVSINIRGVQDFGRINVMIDGARQNYQRSGHGSNGSVYVDPLMLSGVDIEKGPVATLGGAGAIGGVVNFTTLDFKDLVKPENKSGSKVSITRGDNEFNFYGSLATAHKLTEDTELVVALSRKEIGAFEKGQEGGNAGKAPGETAFDDVSEFTDQQHWSGLLKLRQVLNENQALQFSYLGFSSEFEEGDDSASNNNLEATSKSELTNETYRLAHTWQSDNDWWDLKSAFYFNKTSNKQFQSDSGDDSDPYGEFELRYETNTLGISSENLSLFNSDSLASEFSLNTGVEVYQDKTNPKAVRQTEGTGDPNWFTGATPEGVRTVGGLFTQLNWSHNSGVAMLLGMRYDHYRLSGGGEINTGFIVNPPAVTPTRTYLYTDFSVSRNEGFYSPSLTLSYQLVDALQFYVSSSQGARPPSITESLLSSMHVGNSFPFYPNPGLKAERSYNREAGFNLMLEGFFNSHSFWLKGAVFENSVKNLITQARVMRPTSVEEDGTLAYVNAYGYTQYRGSELQADYDSPYFFAELSLSKVFTDPAANGYNQFPLGSLVGFPEPPFGQPGKAGLGYIPAPLHSGSLTIGGKAFEQSLRIAMRLRGQDNQGYGGRQIQDMVDWKVVDFWAKYNWDDNLSLRLAIDNVNDRNYAESNGTSFWVSPGRTTTLNLTFRF